MLYVPAVSPYMRRGRYWLAAAAGAAVVAAAAASASLVPASAASHSGAGTAAGGSVHDGHWVASWGASPSPATPPSLTGPGDHSAAGFSNQTVRDIVFSSVGGSAARVTISNTFGSSPLTVGAADVAVAGQGAAVQPGTTHALTFGGRSSVTIPAGKQIRSDAARMAVPALTDLAVSIYLPGQTGPATYHSDAQQTNYISGTGDFAGQESGAAFTTTSDVYACPFVLHEQFRAGSVRDAGGFTAVWRDSALFTELREPGSAGACASCGSYDACRGGCMASKFFTGLPLDGPDPECVYGHGETALRELRLEPVVVPHPGPGHSKPGRGRAGAGREPVFVTLGRRG